MDGELPEIYWYLFWVGLAIVVEAFGFYMVTVIHRRNMRVLDLLKSYAEISSNVSQIVGGIEWSLWLLVYLGFVVAANRKPERR